MPRSYRDLREYLEVLEQAGKLRRIKKPINKDTELMPLVRWQFRGLPPEDRTGFLFENVVDGQGRTFKGSLAVAVVGGSREIYAMGMSASPEEITHKWVQALDHPIHPILINSGPVKEEIHIGDNLLEHGGLAEFPIPISTVGFDPTPYITAPLWHTKDPETGARNVGTYRGMVKGPLKSSTGGRANHLTVHWQKWKERGKNLEAALVIGAVPAVSICSTAGIPYGVDELAVAGAMMGDPIPVIKCETIDMEVPAYAEIVLEGEFTMDSAEPEGPFGEYTGYMSERGMRPVFNIKCITHRKDPVYHAFISQMPPSESSILRGLAAEGNYLRFLKYDCGLPNVKDVAFLESSGAAMVCVIQIKKTWKPYPNHGEVWQALTATLGKNSGYPKVVIAVDDDIDPRDPDSVLWALSFRHQPHLDVKMIEGRASSLDPSSAPPTAHHSERVFPIGPTGPRGCSAMLIDATLKWPTLPTSLPKEEYMAHAKELWESLDLPKLKPRKPWFGYSLGHWREEQEEEAGLAISGEYHRTWEKLDQQVEPI
ncbi:MAG: UbiD family decarboxylase [Dehalococcoidia bacterium]|nr:UbiD family decarboxylase [Dehalococcoidia bacterium]